MIDLPKLENFELEETERIAEKVREKAIEFYNKFFEWLNRDWGDFNKKWFDFDYNINMRECIEKHGQEFCEEEQRKLISYIHSVFDELIELIEDTVDKYNTKCFDCLTGFEIEDFGFNVIEQGEWDYVICIKKVSIDSLREKLLQLESSQENESIDEFLEYLDIMENSYNTKTVWLVKRINVLYNPAIGLMDWILPDINQEERECDD